jgi:hypothetical protein
MKKRRDLPPPHRVVCPRERWTVEYWLGTRRGQGAFRIVCQADDWQLSLFHSLSPPSLLPHSSLTPPSSLLPPERDTYQLYIYNKNNDNCPVLGTLLPAVDEAEGKGGGSPSEAPGDMTPPSLSLLTRSSCHLTAYHTLLFTFINFINPLPLLYFFGRSTSCLLRLISASCILNLLDRTMEY